ncbi:TPA: type II toxin-antitoxin system RnlA family toxin [Bacillus thuringiensis]|uniref:type II toxin-antitoxin system RnlA family toxin n=1 Tax=Bacillus thuringiensis TaxID=1428 RepID=UPI0018CD7374|nr:type II toxin-antitoxin system RnlA family toxin [Bacillus thuringiensis]MBG9703286.1 hypothetical protein [Bacillus thuringiensis]MEB9532429.1 type II toxin-antitoxin system RnlA family toxin [Bacillus cereus]MEB9727425.1 type II toxin-antitoxin system RnlA family toxin [Bacillus cereus]
MKIQKIKHSKTVCVSHIQGIAKELDVKIQLEEKKGHVVLRLLKQGESDGIVRLYETSKRGQTLDGSHGNISINDMILMEFSERYCQDGGSKIESKTAQYSLSEEKVEEVKEVIEKSAKMNSYVVTVKDAPAHAYYMLEVKHGEKQDKVTISQFQTGTLMIQGRSWEVWDEICNSIDEVLDVPMQEMLMRLMSKEDATVTNVITSNLQSDGEKKIKERLGNAYNFLYEHDKKLITSSQCMFIAEVDYGDYYCYIAPCLRVIEGYLKKVIVDLGLFTETEIEELNTNGKPKFNFGRVFNGSSALVTNIKNKLGTDMTVVAKKESALLRIYGEYISTRNPMQHDGPPMQKMVESYSEAESYFDQIAGVINMTYQELF